MQIRRGAVVIRTWDNVAQMKDEPRVVRDETCAASRSTTESADTKGPRHEDQLYRPRFRGTQRCSHRRAERLGGTTSHRRVEDGVLPNLGGSRPYLVVAHGAFVGGGKDDASHDAYDVLHLGGGTVRVNQPASQSHFKFNVNPKTCFATITGDGKYTLNHGTGRYEDVTGHGTYRFEVEHLLSRTKSGGCNMNAQPKVEVGEIKASGPVKV